ncbi:portal protein [Vreelandella stevensii]|uniref:portal protein n=1 Tax=Vreelandella stevensii TaxID=502821 RepID=UPI00403B17E7
MNEAPTVEMTDELSPDEIEALRQQHEEELSALGAKLHRLAYEQVAAKQQIETRWLEDLRQYSGKYTPDQLTRMIAKGGSQVFVNITRNKTRAAIARLSDMLLPNDDTNFGIKPTPVPSMSRMAPPGMAAQPEMGAPPEAGDEKQRADEAARLMQKQIEDDFTESCYNAHTRDVIQDACLLGTGILKGPTIISRIRRAWTTDPQSGKSIMEAQEDLRPAVERVDPWDFFPDMSAASMREAEFTFERKLLNRKQLRDLADLPGVMLNQLRAALEDKDGQHIAHDRRPELREITGVDTVISDARYELWEYWGPLDKDELAACGCDVDDDPLVEYTGCVLMVGNHVIKAALNPLETDALPYSVFNWEEDGSSIFGFGVPYLMRQPQKVVNAAWRMMMDNAGLSAGPQIVFRKRAVEPVDGDWTIRSNKLWEYTGEGPINESFLSVNIQNNQADLAAIFGMAQEMADTETNLPILLQGEGVSGGPGANTATGMQMLMNNSNIVLRSAVKNFDDGVSVPTVRRFYDYHMMYTDRAEIKGDFDVVAKGTSVLIAREEQQEKLMLLSQVAANNPIFAELTNWQGLYKEILRTLQVPVDNVTYTDEELQQRQQNQGGEEPPPELQIRIQELQLKQQELEIKVQQQQFDQQYKAAELQSKQEVARQELALKYEMTMTQLEAKLGLDSQRLELEMQRTTAQLQNDRDKTAATLMERQNDRQARRANMDMGFDSYG